MKPQIQLEYGYSPQNGNQVKWVGLCFEDSRGNLYRATITEPQSDIDGQENKSRYYASYNGSIKAFGHSINAINQYAEITCLKGMSSILSKFKECHDLLVEYLDAFICKEQTAIEMLNGDRPTSSELRDKIKNLIREESK